MDHYGLLSIIHTKHTCAEEQCDVFSKVQLYSTRDPPPRFLISDLVGLKSYSRFPEDTVKSPGSVTSHRGNHYR